MFMNIGARLHLPAVVIGSMTIIGINYDMSKRIDECICLVKITNQQDRFHELDNLAANREEREIRRKAALLADKH